MKERTIESDFGAAIAELSKQPLSKLFLFKSRMLGARLDASALRRRGWKDVERPHGEPLAWEGCLWFEKRVGTGADTVLVRVGTSGLVQGNPNGGPSPKPVPEQDWKKRLLSDEPASVHLRTVGFFRDEDGGLRRRELFADVSDDLLAPVESDLRECVLENWDSLLSDLSYQTGGLSREMPPYVFETPFTKAANVLNGLLLREEYARNRLAFERLLVRLVRTIADPSFDPAASKELEVFPDGWALWNFVHFWFAAAPHDGAAMRLLAYALGQADLLSEPYTETGWSGFALKLGPLGFFKEAVFAADRALDCPGAGETQARILWNAVVDFVQDRFPGSDPEDEPVDVAWLIQILYEREAVLCERDGYWTLLGLCLAINGNDIGTAAKTIQKVFDMENSDSAKRISPQVRRPRDWQALMCTYFESFAGIRKALASFPDPVLSKEWGKMSLRQKVVPGMFDPDFLVPILELKRDGDLFVVDPAPWKDKAVLASDKEWCWLSVPETSPCSKGIVVATTMRRYREADAEIELFLVEGSCDPKRPDAIGFRRILPLANPGTTNIVGAAWEFHPYDDNCCGEIRFRMDGFESSLTAASAFFATDRKYIRRGMPFPGYVYALPLDIHHAKPIPPAMTPDGKTVNIDGSRFMFEHPSEDSRALYEFHGEVVSVRKTKVSAGGEVLCLELNVGDAKLPCALPVYVREDLIEGAPAKIGDVLDGLLFLQVDFFPPDAHSRQWLDAHPDGPGPEPGADENPLLRGYPVSFGKRSPNGKKRIPVLGEEPGKTVEIDDPTPTPESFDAVDAAYRRLRDAFGCEEIVRWSPNPEEIDFAARVHGRVERYRVVKTIGDGEVKTGPDASTGGIRTLVVRLRDTGKQWSVEYDGFPEKEIGA